MEPKTNDQKDDHGAFMLKFHLSSPSLSPRPLDGLTFAAKEIFDIKDYVTGFGNPDWARTHAEATDTSPVVLALVEAGATCVGKTVMDEMAYSINGENKHYGTPRNPVAPDRVPGGSSSGSAVAVAAKLVDFSLGTDTGGSVRVPAAYCGIFGFRPSHGVISVQNMIPMAQSFDTVGWFARDLMTLNRVGQVLLPSCLHDNMQPSRVIIPEDCFQLSSPSDQLSQIASKSIEKVFGGNAISKDNLGDFIMKNVPSLEKFVDGFSDNVKTNIPVLAALSHTMRSLQRFEFKINHGEWLNATRPDLGPGISERVSEALNSTNKDIEQYRAIMSELRNSLANLLQDFGILALPTVPGPPPKLGTDSSALESFRARAFSLLSIAGMSGFCQINIPLGMHDNLPVSISLLANHGADKFLLNVALKLSDSFKEQARIAWQQNN